MFFSNLQSLSFSFYFYRWTLFIFNYIFIGSIDIFYLLLAALISMFSHVYFVKNYNVELEINFAKINFMMLLKLKLKDQGLKLIF